MRASAVIAIAAAGVGLLVPASAASRPRYYLSLGDSLAVGVQPNGPPPYQETDTGYVDQLFAVLQARRRELVKIKLGCGGESSRSMIEGSLLPPAASCGPPAFYAARYPEGTQLATAERFLRTHRGQVELVTIDVGANDVGACVAGVDRVCVEAGLHELEPRLAAILHRLRRAGARLIVGMTYYDPFLGAWLDGAQGQAFARASNDNVLAVNATLTRLYRTAGARVADVAGAFRIADFSTQASGLPLNVALACEWTWFCTAPPLGPDVHANTEGYGVIAHAFAEQLTGRAS